MLKYFRLSALCYYFAISSFFVNSAFSGLAPNPNFSSQVTSSGSEFWTSVELTLTNNSNAAIDMRDSVVQFTTPGSILFNTYSGPLSYPNVSTSSSSIGYDYINKLTLAFDSGPWVITTLEPHQMIHLSFGLVGIINNDAVAKSVIVYTNSVVPCSNSLTVKAPQKPGSTAGMTATALITSAASYSQNVSLSWSNSTTLYGLCDGHYIVHTNPSGSYPGGPDQTINLNSVTHPTATVTLTYGPPLAQVEANLLVSGLPNNGSTNVSLIGPGKYAFNSLSNGTHKINVIEGTYQITASPYISNDMVYNATLSSSYPIIENTNINIEFIASPLVNSQFLAFVAPGYDISGAPYNEMYNPTYAFILHDAQTNGPIIWGTQSARDKVSTNNHSWVSVGGANGPYTWDYESVATFLNGLIIIQQTNGFAGIDFDIEGAAYATPSVHNWVANAIKAIKTNSLFADVKISLTLPDPFNPGFNADELALIDTINTTVSGSSRIMAVDYINKMNFDWSGAQGACSLVSSDPQHNCYAQSMANAAATLQAHYGMSSSQAYAILGSIFMIGGWNEANGCDDQGVCNTIAGFQNAAALLTQKGIKTLGYWQAMGDSTQNFAWWSGIHTGITSPRD